ncbi:MAG TPA: hypothetical protein PLN08_10985 [Solirubrobacterales bacterium]|nr:hypothetical protein [Solirubrobacterales bacterium]HNA25010.1 hypothetical protein [Solirubrobacterales bacterium]HNA45361.1 hypothetical protein [Solirubrobacterales bacterium]HNE78530.1 hypothetical protein [Solirubrobacterales bacterium]HNF82815.1 hypothetical protein [Solirubrobacterales bacterium]
MNGFESKLRSWLEAIGRWNPPSWIPGLMIALLGWTVGFAHPFGGLDSSWWVGLYLAAHNQMQFGTEIVFTYGPLGILRFPWLLYPGALAVIPFVYASILHVGFSSALVAALRRRVGLLWAMLVALLVVVQLEWVEQEVAISILAAMLMIERRPAGRKLLFFAVCAGLLAGTEMLVKLSTGPVIAAVLLVGLVGARARTREIAAYLGTLAGSMLVCWFVTGQDLSNLPDFIGNSIQIVLGYQEAMAVYGQSGWYSLIIVAGGALCFAWALFGGYADRRARIAGALVAAIVIFVFYKQAVVRIDSAHIALFFALIAVLWLAVPPRQGFAGISLAGLAFMGVVSIYAATGVPSPGLNLISNLRGFYEESRTALSPARQRAGVDFWRQGIRHNYQLDPKLLAELEGQSVSVEPWETTAAWAFELDWHPAPVFQNYSAYTSALDELNSDTIESATGPGRILRHVGDNPFGPTIGLDGRFMAWDPPGQAIAELCNFRPIGESGRWQVLARTANRCGPLVPAGVVESRFGETVPVPKPGPNEVVIAKIHGAEVHGLERLRSFFYRPAERRAVVEGGSYRLIAATAADGLMMRIGRNIPEGRGDFAQAPQTPTIALTGPSGDLKYEFFRFRVRSAGPGLKDRPRREARLKRRAQLERRAGEAAQTVTAP